MSILSQLKGDLERTFLTGTKCKALFIYDKVSASGATSIPRCANKSGGSLDALRGSPKIPN